MLRCGGFQGGYDTDTVLKPLAMLAKQYNVNEVVVESNFGDAMFNHIFRPILSAVHPCSLEEVRHHTQKERRMADTIEPVMTRHRLVMDPAVITEDYRSVQKYDSEVRRSKSLVHQMTRLTRDRGCLRHDDRLDALSMAVSYWTESMAKDEQEGILEMHEEAMQKEIDKVLDHWGIPQGQSSGWGAGW